MKNRRTPFIDVDLNVYSIYVHVPSETIFAFPLNETGRFHKLLTEHDGFASIPDEETIDGIPFQFNSKKNAYDIQSKTLVNVKFNELYYAYIFHPHTK